MEELTEARRARHEAIYAEAVRREDWRRLRDGGAPAPVVADARAALQTAIEATRRATGRIEAAQERRHA